MNEILDRTVAFKESAKQREEARVGHVDRAKSQALTRRERNRLEPSIELRVAKLCEVHHATGASYLLLDAVRSTKDVQVARKQLTIGRLEVDLSESGEQATVSCNEADYVCH